MDLHPIFLGPTTPPDLLWFLIHSCAYPTTVIVCSSRDDFLTSLTKTLLSKQQKSQSRHVKQEQSDDEAEPQTDRYSLLGTAPLYQIAIAKHLRIVFTPTVSHLRAYLSVFSPEDSPVPPPPSALTTTDAGEVLYGRDRASLLLVYGFLEIHHRTSEWTVVGLSNTASVLVEAARRAGFRAVVTEPKRQPHSGLAVDTTESDIKMEEEDEKKQGNQISEDEDVYLQSVPFIKDRSIRIDLTGTGLGQKMVKVRNIMERWFRFREDGLEEGIRL